MKYRFILFAALIASSFISHSGMAAEGTNTEKDKAVVLTKLCQECLLHCAKSRQYKDFSFIECAEEVCHDVCKIINDEN